jgi:hypothetical protein
MVALNELSGFALVRGIFVNTQLQVLPKAL